MGSLFSPLMRPLFGPVVVPWGAPSPVTGGGVLPIVTADLVAYGGNIGSVTAAMKAADLGMTTVIINDLAPARFYGMMLGILNVDVETTRGKGTVRGWGDKLFKRLSNLYSSGALSQETFIRDYAYGSQPTFIRSVLDAMLAERLGINVYHDEQLASVTKTGTRITSLKTNKRDYRASTYADSHYCGDLLAAAGCTTFVGRESTATYGESNAGIRAASNAYSTTVSPYVTPGNPASGLLPGIRDEAYGTVGAASDEVQSIGFRWWNYPTTLSSSPAPDTYDANGGAARYTLAKRNILAKGLTTLAQVLTEYPVRLGTDVNTNGGSSPAGQAFNYTGPEVKEYITATPARRKEIEKVIMDWQLGYVHWARNDTDLPSGIRTGFAALRVKDVDAWPDTPSYPGINPNIYIRQGRLVRGDKVLRQQDVVDARPTFPTPDPYEIIQIGRIIYAGDRHWSRTLVVADGAAVDGYRVVNEGGMALATQLGAPIPAWVVWPKKSECSNLFSTFCISASAIAHGSTRMETLSMHFGEAGAAMAYLQKQNPSWDIQDTLGAYNVGTGNYDVDTTKAAEFRRLFDFWNLYDTNGGAVVVVPSTNPSPNAPANVNGGTVTSTGTWTTPSGNTQPAVPFTGAVGQAGAIMRFAPKIDVTGVYEVRLSWAESTVSARHFATIFRVVHAGGTYSTTKDQNTGGNHTGDWCYAGARPASGTAAERDAGEVAASRFTFNAGNPSEHYVEVEVPATGGTSIIAAVKFVRIS